MNRVVCGGNNRIGKGKGKRVQQFATSLAATGTYVTYGIGKGNIPAFIPAN